MLKQIINQDRWGTNPLVRDPMAVAPSQGFAAAEAEQNLVVWNVSTATLISTLPVEANMAKCLAFDAPGQRIAGALKKGGTDQDVKPLQIWDSLTGKPLVRVTSTLAYTAIAFSADGNKLFAGISSGRVTEVSLLKIKEAPEASVRTISIHDADINALLPLPGNEGLMASCSNDHTICIWDPAQSNALQNKLEGHTKWVNCLAVDPEGGFLLSGSGDSTIKMWDLKEGKLLRTFEGHTKEVGSIDIDPSGVWALSGSSDNTLKLWDLKNGSLLTTLEGWRYPAKFVGSREQILARKADRSGYDLLEVDLSTLEAAAPSHHYINSKVVLVGDSGVGKSGLRLVLTNTPFEPTYSTHGRFVAEFKRETLELESGDKETHEVLLWDLAGQPGYRLVHQLQLREVAVALVVYDSKSAQDPFSGVNHWVRALDTARRVEGSSAVPLKKFLIAARMDRGSVGISRERIQEFMRRHDFEGHFETSAMEGAQIPELIQAISDAIEWDQLPRVTSNELFDTIKKFLLKEKSNFQNEETNNVVLAASGDLYNRFRAEAGIPHGKDLENNFLACIGRLESRGLIRRMSFGDLILLQPELLDCYASSIVEAAKNEPDGLGAIEESRVLAGDFFIPTGERLKDAKQEQLLLLATVQDLLWHEVGVSEPSSDGNQLVFPSQLTLENPNLEDPQGTVATLEFEGPVANVYATLVVRLSHSEFFERSELWKNGIVLNAATGGSCGLYLQEPEEGKGVIAIFYSPEVDPGMRLIFEQFVQVHLQRNALEGSIVRQGIIACHECGIRVSIDIINRCLELGKTRTRCGVCDTFIELEQAIDPSERSDAAEESESVDQMNEVADAQRRSQTAQMILKGLRATKNGQFDVFLCHNGADKAEVKAIGQELVQQEILPWLDEWELRPGLPWQRELQSQIRSIRSACVFIGKEGIGAWQEFELYGFLKEFTRRQAPVIPVFLPEAPEGDDIPVFLREMTHVDFRKTDPDPMERLRWGITGENGLP